MTGEADLMRVDEAARALRMGVSTLNRWRSQGKGPEYVKIGGRVFYRPSAIREFLESCVRTKTRGD